MITLLCLVTVALLAFVVGAAVGGVVAAKPDQREVDHSAAWQREAARQRAEALRWKGLALRRGWRWDTVDAIRAWRRR